MERGGQRGQSAVEVVALVPVLAAILVGGLALAVAAAGWLSAAGAARVGARAAEVGDPIGPAARSALPAPIASRARVVQGSEWVEVRLPPPRAGSLGSLAPPPARSRPAP